MPKSCPDSHAQLTWFASARSRRHSRAAERQHNRRHTRHRHPAVSSAAGIE
ncbi:hypothetical protein [Phytoactinopolyspora halophila]|uniref:hypothetical protein n=1 Tax=Phytoactinopolyspora halophila TaxID=1981511 RepID=UPI001314FEB0|nr:hypothetical protein [Phytoactinopolyspora halophila]